MAELKRLYEMFQGISHPMIVPGCDNDGDMHKAKVGCVSCDGEFDLDVDVLSPSCCTHDLYTGRMIVTCPHCGAQGATNKEVHELMHLIQNLEMISEEITQLMASYTLPYFHGGMTSVNFDKPTITCHKCSNEFIVKLEKPVSDVALMLVCDGNFKCPHCDELYVATFMDKIVHVKFACLVKQAKLHAEQIFIVNQKLAAEGL